MAIGFHGLSTLLPLIYSYIFLASGARNKRPPFCNNLQDDDEVSFLWSVKRDPPSYFFGTIHVPYTRVWDYIPENAKQAFELSKNVFFELDLMDPKTIAGLANCQMLPPGTNLSDVLPRDIYKRLKRHLDYVKLMMPSWMTIDQQGRGMYADYLFNAITGNWERKRPVWVMLMVNSLTESDVKSRGIPVLDLYLAQEAQRMDKYSGAIEKVEEQCLPLNGLNFSQVLFALNHTLYQHESVRSGDVRAVYTTDDLIKHYNCGDLDAVIFSHDSTQVPHLLNTSVPPENFHLARNIDHYFREELVYRRNRRMGERVVQLLNAQPEESFFFAFGAGHFLGNDTVLDFVQKGGFEIELVPPSRKIKGTKKLSQPAKGGRSSGSLSGFVSVDLQQARDTYSDSRGRRRYRKRQNQQPRTTHAPSRGYQRKFNDLWVRLETVTPSSHLPQSDVHTDSEHFKNSLKLWYGLPSSGPQKWSSSRSLLLLCTFFYWIVLLR